MERAVDRVPFLEKELFLLRHLVGPGAVCLDVGAAGGAHLLVLSRLVGPTGRIHGFEPRPSAHRWLRTAIRLLRRHNVEVHRCALGARPGSARMRVPVVPTRAHLGGDARHDAFGRLPGRSLSVPVTTVDAFATDHRLARIDLVKTDVEGAEPDVLAGAGRTLERFRPVVLCEVWADHLRRYDRTPVDVFEHFRSVGYRAHTYGAGTLTPVAAATDAEDDYVFLPADRPSPLPFASSRAGR